MLSPSEKPREVSGLVRQIQFLKTHESAQTVTANSNKQLTTLINA
jgi:hypothetical protein